MSDDIVERLGDAFASPLAVASADVSALQDAADEIERLQRSHTHQCDVHASIVEQLRRWDDGRISTHYEGCWDSHPVCAILLAADAIEARDAEIERLRAEVEQVRLAIATWREARRER
jgi:nitrate reductase assembly molybdenum cofactor insertion protein NarJ